MIHPSTRLAFIDDMVGHGVIATDFIPLGTITYVKDEMEVVIEAGHRLHCDKRYQPLIEKYSYTEPNGNKVLSWDIAKYVNHSCEYNTLSTGYGFEIAIRDIYPGEQITDDYGLFNIENQMSCLCGAASCRVVIGGSEFVDNTDAWDRQVRRALSCVESVTQPLLEYIDSAVMLDLKKFLLNGRCYQSVKSLQLNHLQEVAV